VRLIGVRNVPNVRLLQRLAVAGGKKVDIVQNRWHEGNDWDIDVTDYCREEGIHYESFWPLTGFLSLLKHPSILSISQKKSCTPHQALSRLAQEWGVIPFVVSENEAHMKNIVDAETISLENVRDDVEEVRKITLRDYGALTVLRS